MPEEVALPLVVNVLLALITALCAAGVAISLSNRTMLGKLHDKVAEINGSVRENRQWIRGHEKHTDEQNDRIKDLERAWRENDRRARQRHGLTEE